MITDCGKYFLYRHIRCDTNEVFYIGIGKKRVKKWQNPYARMLEKKGRNRFWILVVNQTEYIAEALLESDSKEFIYQKEREFIALYGRRDFGKGSLVNLTDGGDKFYNSNEETKRIWKESMIKNGTWEKARQGVKKAWKEGRMTPTWLGKKGKNFFKSKKCYVYNTDGSFYRSFDSQEETAIGLKIKCSSSICKAMNGLYLIKGKKVFDKYQGNKIEPFLASIGNAKRVYQINIETLGIRMFFSPQTASNELNIKKRNIFYLIKTKRIFNGFAYSYSSDFNLEEFVPYSKWKDKINSQ